ncbi:p48 polypeptide of DNA primase [Entomophthora muscae]|uniref:P48 polypeptide of DNA primase n=1 Tax=Entomophthora muscae TaxID=34485 RepID=A0ACC2RZL8_9FUNG|nr:p48 polypeptide of DNA primase [Entomophthora muscae]
MSSKSEHLAPESRELVFDVDLTDYDDIRTCCNKTTICPKCWGFMRVAMKIIHRTLTEDFGFRHIMWVFSGGRGIHAWVCDKRARSLSNEGRRAIANYLTITRPGGPRRVVLPQTLHPSISDVMELVEEAFATTVLGQQDILNSDKKAAILENLPEDIRNELQEKWESTTNYVSSQTRWEQLEYSVSKRQKQAKGKEATLLATLVRDLKLHCCFPRLDVHVSTSMNHLLKAPFCIHPRSRKICVPISLDQFDSFDPESVPTDYTLISELNKDSSPGGSYTAKKTSVWPYIQTFQSFVDALLADQPKKHIGSLDF